MKLDRDVLWHKYLRRPYRLHVQDSGGDKPVVILLHGIAASSDKWNLLLPQLSDQFRCITLDLVGFGKSPKPQWYSYTMDDHLRAIHYTIGKLHLRRPYTLIGHSLGSLLASRYARLNPRSVRSLVLISPPIYAPVDSILSKAARARNQLLLKIYKFLRSHPIMTPENLKRLSFIVPLPKSVWQLPETRLPFMRTLEHCIETQTISEDLAAINVPVHIFYGTLDQVVVAYNIRQLKSLDNITIRGVRGANHDVGKRLALAVAEDMLTFPDEMRNFL